VRLPASATLPVFRECGSMLLRNKNSRSFIDPNLDVYRKFDVPFELLDNQQAEARAKLAGWDLSRSYVPRRVDDDNFAEPVEGQCIDGAFYMKNTGYISDPRLAAESLAQAAVVAGARFCYGSRVVKIVKAPGQARVTGVELANGDSVCAPVVVNAGGPWSSRVNELAFDGAVCKDDSKIHARPLRAEVAFLPAPEGIDLDKHGMVGADFDLGIYFRPEVGNKLLVGSIDPHCDPLEWVEGDLDQQDRTLQSQWQHNVYRAALRMPGIKVPSARHAQGVVSSYDATEDFTPILDKSILSGYFLAIGTSGNCFKCSPGIGRYMARLIDHSVNKGVDHDKNPVSFTLPKLGKEVDGKLFSRLRDPHKMGDGVLG